MKKSSHPTGIVREAGLYGFGTLAAQVISALRGLVIAGMLGPASYGLWKSLQVGLDYLGYTHFGILHGMARRISIARSEGDGETVRAAAKLGLGAAIGSSAIVGVAILAWVWNYSSPLRECWFGIAGLLVLGQLIRFLALRCQAEGRLEILSLAEFTWASVSFAAMVLLVPKYQVLGVLLGLGAGFSSAVLIAWLQGIYPSIDHLRKREAPGVSSSLLKDLVKTGFPFMFVDGLFVIWQRIDLMALVFIFGAESEEIGWYGLATMVASFAVQIPQIQMKVLFRRVVRESALQNDAGPGSTFRLKKHLVLPVWAVACATPPLFGVGIAFARFFVRLFLPAYAPAKSSIALLILACYWTSIGLSVRNLYTAANRQWILSAIYGAAILLTVAIIFSLAGEDSSSSSPSILIGGLGMLAASALFAVAALWDNGRVCGLSFPERIKLLAAAILPFIPLAFWTWIAGAWTDTQSVIAPTGDREWIRLAYNLGTCLALTFPALAIGYWRLIVLRR